MKEFENWNELEEKEVVSITTVLPVGIYPAKIIAVKDIVEKEYLEIKFDIAKGEYTDFFKKNMFNGEWPNQGIYRVSYKDNEYVRQLFRGFITAIQKSNQNYVWNWNEQSLVGKYFIVVMGEEEYLSKDGDVKIAIKPRQARSIEAYQKGDVKLLPLKKLKKQEDKPAISAEELLGDLPF